MFETQKADLSLRREASQPWSRRARLAQHKSRLAALLVLLTVIALWALLVAWQKYPPFILPSPALVWQKFLLMAADGSILFHIGVTLVEIALGLLIGLSAASGLGYLLGKHRALEHIAAPYIVASQSIPIVAIADHLLSRADRHHRRHPQRRPRPARPDAQPARVALAAFLEARTARRAADDLWWAEAQRHAGCRWRGCGRIHGR
jgi:hypothetical protein